VWFGKLDRETQSDIILRKQKAMGRALKC